MDLLRKFELYHVSNGDGGALMNFKKSNMFSFVSFGCFSNCNEHTNYWGILLELKLLIQ